MKLILHIGTEKTGSTTIQNFLDENRNILKDNDILIPSSTSVNGNHTWITLFGYLEKDYENFNKIKEFKRNKELSKKLEEFKREINSSNSKICIISSEHLSGRLKNQKQIKKLYLLLNDLFEEINIIIYIRKPINAAISLLSTMIKSGGTPKGLDLDFFSNYLNNRSIIDKWTNIFENVKVQIFEREEFFENDIIKDFFKISQLDYFDNLKHSGFFYNKSLDLIQMRYLCYLNKLIPIRNNDGSINPKRRNLNDFIIKNFSSTEKYLPTSIEYKKFEEYFAKDNEHIRNKFFGNRKTLWPKNNQEKFGNNKLNALSAEEIKLLNALAILWKRIT